MQFDQLLAEKLKSAKRANGIVLQKSEWEDICTTLDVWPTMTAAQRSAKNAEFGGNRAYRWAKKFKLRKEVDDAGEVEFTLLEKQTDEDAGGAEEEPQADPAPVQSSAEAALDKAYRIVLHAENMYSELLTVHVAGGHCKARTFDLRVKDKYSRIPRWVCEILCDTCSICVARSTRKATTPGHQPILTKGFGSRGQIDLIDLQSCPDGDYKFLLNYQDHGLKFYDNRPLQSKRAAAVAFALLDIFTLIGPPCILQSDNGKEFANAAYKTKSVTLSDNDVREVIEEIASVWPDVKLVHGRARHSESQGGIERLNRTCQEKLGKWMAQNQSKKWTVGRLFVRWQINTQLHQTVGTKPYNLVFGMEPRLGLRCLPLSRELLDSLSSEAQVSMQKMPHV